MLDNQIQEALKNKSQTNQTNQLGLDPRRQPRILIVEDDDVMRTALVRMIQIYPLQFNCIDVPNWETAKREIESLTPDLLITDFYLDSGKTAMDLLRRTSKGPLNETDCLIISGGTPLPTLFAAEREGLRIRFMKKPIDRGLLDKFLKFDLDPGYYL